MHLLYIFYVELNMSLSNQVTSNSFNLKLIILIDEELRLFDYSHKYQTNLKKSVE